MSYDNSKLQTFKNCPESYRLKYLRGLKKRQEGVEDHDKNFGSAIHHALELHYKGAAWSDIEATLHIDYPVQLNEEDKAKTLPNAIELVRAYIEHYRREDKAWRVIATEVKDTFEVAPGIQFTVKMDLVVEQQNCIYFVDHKTTGKALNWSYWSQFDPNSQITAYTAYCQSKFGECSGGMINALQLGFRSRAYKGEPAGFHCSFQRQLFSRNRDQVAAWKADSLLWISAMDALTRDADKVWHKNEGQCRFCNFKEICISCCDEQIIEQLYESHDPNAYLKETV